MAQQTISALKVLGKSMIYAMTGISTCYCGMKFVCGLGRCEDDSMLPTIRSGDVVLLSSYYVNHRLLKKGDVVFCRSPKNPRSLVCKRLVGMEGETIHNDEKGFDEFFVDKGHVWLEGDNKAVSIDSRTFGSLPYGLLNSKVTLRILPLKRFGFLDTPPPAPRINSSYSGAVFNKTPLTLSWQKTPDAATSQKSPATAVPEKPALTSSSPEVSGTLESPQAVTPTESPPSS